MNLVKPFGNYELLNTRSTAKNLNEMHRRHVIIIEVHGIDTIDHLVWLIVLKSKLGSAVWSPDQLPYTAITVYTDIGVHHDVSLPQHAIIRGVRHALDIKSKCN